MRLHIALTIAFSVGACDDADDGPGGAASCEDAALIAQCPPGSNPQLGSIAEAMCSGAAGAILSDETGAATGNCVGTSQCQVACQWASPCLCGVASVTREGIQCQPCDPDRGCGNGVCDPGESPETCAIDCGARCMPGESRCGNEGGRQSCNLQGVWEDLACPDGQICEVQNGQADCVLDIVDPGPEGEPDPEPGPDFENNACWTFGPGEAPSNGAYLQPGDCRGLERLGPAFGPLSADGQYTLRFDAQRGLLRYPVGLELIELPDYRDLLQGCESVSPAFEVSQRLQAIYDPDHLAQQACLQAALVEHCEPGEGEALFAAFDACGALDPPHLALDTLGDMAPWPPRVIRSTTSPNGRYALIRWRGMDDASIQHLAVFDYRDQTFERLAIPEGYNIANSILPGENPNDTAHFDFAYDQRTLVGMVQFEGEQDSALAVWDLQTGDVRLTLPGQYGRQPRVSADGRFVHFRDNVFIDLATEEVFAEFTCQDDILASGAPPDLNRTGHYRVGWPFGEPEPDLDRMRIAAEASYREVYSPDGSTMLYPKNGAIEVWDIESNARVEILQPGESSGPVDGIWPAQDCRYLIANGVLYGPVE